MLPNPTPKCDTNSDTGQATAPDYPPATTGRCCRGCPTGRCPGRTAVRSVGAVAYARLLISGAAGVRNHISFSAPSTRIV